MINEGHALVVGATGAGKTVTAKGMTEELLRDSRHVCIIDPTGVWYGLRTLADGESEGFQIPIFGGLLGDVPISPDQGSVVGKIIAEGVSAVIDLSQMDSYEQQQFVADLISALRREKPKSNFHFVVDEADEFAPQTSPSAAGEAAKRQMEWIAKRGRVQGFVLMAITQRVADIAKSVISQMQTVVMHQLTSPSDQGAIKSYLKDNASKETLVEVMESLAGLGTGERWVYSPRAGQLDLGMSPLPTTFDTSRTPEPGEDPVEPKMLGELDLGAIEAALAPDEPEEDESSNDLPAAHNSEEILKRDQRIAELERRLSIAEKTANLRGNTLLRQHTLIRQAFSSADQLASMLDIAPPDEMPVDYLEIPAQGGGGSEREPDQDGAVKTAPVKPQRAPSNGAGQGVTDGETSQKSKGNHPPRHQRILDALAWSVKMLSRDSVDRKIVAWFADTSPKSSGYEKDLGAMRTAGLIEYPGRGLVALTQAGGELANWPASPPTQAEFVAAIKRKLEPRHGRILDGVLAYQGRSIDRETLASDIGTSVISSGFQKDLGKLRTLGLIDYPKPGLVELGAVFV